MLCFENHFSSRKCKNAFLIFSLLLVGDIKGQHTETLLAGSLAKALCCILGAPAAQRVPLGRVCPPLRCPPGPCAHASGRHEYSGPGLSHVRETRCENSEGGEWGTARRSGLSLCGTLPRLLSGRLGLALCPVPESSVRSDAAVPGPADAPGHRCLVAQLDISCDRRGGSPVAPGFGSRRLWVITHRAVRCWWCDFSGTKILRSGYKVSDCSRSLEIPDLFCFVCLSR